MKPLSFPQANRNLTAPAGMTREECGDLPTFTDGRHCISLWGLTRRERLRVLLTGRVWLWVWSGQTQPPVSLDADSPFVERRGWGCWFRRPATFLAVALLLAACSGSRPAPKPPASPTPSVSTVPSPEATATPRPPRPDSPGDDGGTPPPPLDKPDRLTICHVEDRSDTGDRHRITMTLPRPRAEWHLKEHGPKGEGGDGRGDTAGECKGRESKGAALAGPRAQPPNILVVLTDDQDVGTMPVMAKVQSLWAAQGVTFSNMIASDPLCCPGRASLLTGQYAHNHGVWSNNPPGGYQALDYRTTLPVWMQVAGYDTAWFGKFLNGYGTANAPWSSGPVCDEVPAGWDAWYAFLVKPYYNHYLISAGPGTVLKFGTPSVPPGCVVDSSNGNVYSTDKLANRAANYISSHASSGPWFLVVAPYAPHETDQQPPIPAPRHAGLFANDPFPIPGSLNYNEADVSDKPALIQGFPLLTTADTEERAAFHRKRREALLAVDELVEDLEGALVASGQAANTVRVYTSDNGWLNGEHRAPGWKFLPYEESIRLPLIVRGPGYQAGATRMELVSQTDLAPTLVALAGGTATRTMDGADLGPLLRGEPAQWRSALLVASRQQSIYDAVRTATHVYAEHINAGEQELYDLGADPGQLESKHADPAYASIKAALAGTLAVLRTCIGAACWVM